MQLSAPITELLPLMEELTGLREDNQRLRDDNDTLRRELEEWRKGHRVRGRRRGKNKTRQTRSDPPNNDPNSDNSSPEARKAGRKLGHEGAGRPGPQSVDYTEICRRTHGPDCADVLLDQGVGHTHIVEELVIRVETTAYECLDQYCERCNKTWRAPLPPNLGGAPSLGPNIQAVAMSLRFEHGLTLGETSRIFSNVFDLPFSPGGLS